MHLPTINALSGMLSALGRAPKALQDELENELVRIEIGKAAGDAVMDMTHGRTPDQWNRSDAGRDTPGIDTGHPERASGNGADAMTGRYSDPAPQSQASMRGYDELSERLKGLEKAMHAVVGFLSAAAKASGTSFPSDADGENGSAEEGETSADQEDDNQADSAAEKAGRIPVLTIPAMMEAISGKSRNSTITPPPSFLSKANAASAEERLADADHVSLEDAIRAQTAIMRARAVAAGHLDASQYRRALAQVDSQLQTAIGL